MGNVGRIDWSFTGGDRSGSETIRGLVRSVLIDRSVGAVHTELAAASLAPGGFLATHVHAYEEAFFVLAGEMTVEIDRHAWRLAPGDFALLPVGTWHTVANLGAGEARWLAANTPQRFGPDDGRRDTYFDPSRFDLQKLEDAVRPNAGDPTTRCVGHVPDPKPGATAISATPLVDRAFGADLLQVLHAVGPAGAGEAPRDHPFEESYVILEGVVEAVLDGTVCELHAGDWAFAGVRALHEFRNPTAERATWLMVQAPQPPLRHAARFPDEWDRLGEAGRR